MPHDWNPGGRGGAQPPRGQPARPPASPQPARPPSGAERHFYCDEKGVPACATGSSPEAARQELQRQRMMLEQQRQMEQARHRQAEQALQEQRQVERARQEQLKRLDQLRQDFERARPGGPEWRQAQPRPGVSNRHTAENDVVSAVRIELANESLMGGVGAGNWAPVSSTAIGFAQVNVAIFDGVQAYETARTPEQRQQAHHNLVEAAMGFSLGTMATGVGVAAALTLPALPAIAIGIVAAAGAAYAAHEFAAAFAPSASQPR